MADINERVNIETKGAVENVDGLKSSLEKADEWIDNVIETARKADGSEISIPIETPGAKEAAAELDAVDTAARNAGGGAQVGLADITDAAGPLGDVAGKAGELGGAFEGMGALVESAGAKMGLSAATAEKLGGTIAGIGLAVAAGTVLWQQYRSEQDKNKKTQEEIKKAFEDTQAALAKGDTAAAADTFLTQFGEGIDDIAKRTGIAGGTIVNAILGDPTQFDAFKQGVAGVKVAGIDVGEVIGSLRQKWLDSKTAFDSANEMKQTVVEAFNQSGQAARDFADDAENAASAYEFAQIRIRGAAGNGALPPGSALPGYTDLADTWRQYGAKNPGATNVTYNVFPAANTPLAVEHATAEYSRIQGPI